MDPFGHLGSGRPVEPRRGDVLLVEAARSGDPDAVESLYKRHVDRVTGMAFRLLGRDTELEDVVQDSFIYAFTHLDKLKQPAAFSSWLSSIVTGTAIATLRRRRLLRRLGLLRAEPVEFESLIAVDAPPDVAAELRAVYRAVDMLAAEERVVLLLRRVEQLPLEAIAEHTGRSLATVKRKLAKAEARLRATFEEVSEDP